MPYDFHSEDCGVLVEFYGVYSFKDNSDATVELYTHPKFGDLKYIIWDFSEVSDMDMTPTEVDIASKMDKEASLRLRNTKVALVTQDPFTKVLCKSYIADCQKRNMKWEFQILNNIEQARNWIGA